MYLVTGGSGLVGKAIQTLKPDWVFVSSKDADLTNIDSTRALFEKHNPATVIHLAAAVGGLYANLAANLDFYTRNTDMNRNVLKCCDEYNTRLVSCLSTCVFPNKTTYPIDETMLHDGPPHPSNIGYSYAKRMLEVESRLYRKQNNCDFVTVIPTNMFGPHDNFSLEDSHVIPGLIHRCYIAVRDGTDFIVSGTGKPVRQFLYSNDAARMIVWAAEHTSSTLILAPDSELSIREVAFKIALYMHLPYERVLFNTLESDGQYKKTASSAKFIREHGQFVFTPFDEALEKTIMWFIANYDTCRK